MIKRSIDFVGAAFGLFLCAPILLLIAVAIRLSNGSPVLFRQERIGYRNRKFTLTKFRTMTVTPSTEPLDTTQDAVRLTRLGTFLRKTKSRRIANLVERAGWRHEPCWTASTACGILAALQRTTG